MARRGPRAQDSKRYYDWLYKAEEDLHSARLLKAEEICHMCAAFHCQQCIEKALKAYILYQTNILHDGHNLTWLCKQAVKLDREFIEWLDESADLNRYYIETRYPTDIPVEIHEAEVERAYRMAKAMYDFILDQLGEEMEEE